MAPKGSKSNEDVKEDPLRAVLVADTFETKFAPFTFGRPRCLLPLANVPLIDYTLGFLASAGVEEVFIYAGAHVEQVEIYIKASRWSATSPTTPFKVFRFLRCQASSVGDIMRDLDQKGLMGSTGDFLIVSGDVICDFPIARAVRKHRDRREKDKNAIMTMILRANGPGRFVSEQEVMPTFVIDPTVDRCLHYEESVVGNGFGVHVDPEVLKTAELDIRQDLVDCRVDICTPDVLSLWSDNFDNQAPRKDFLYGVLKDYELNGKTIHTYIVDNHYANRAADLKSYAEITMDLEKSLSAGLSLENNLHGTRYKRSRNGLLKENDVIVVRSSKLSADSIVGEGSSVGADTIVAQSVIGRRCQIGKRTTINSSYIWDDTTIGTDVTISKAIIGSEVFIGDGCTVGEGALISFGAHIKSGTKIPPGAKIEKEKQSQTDSKDGNHHQIDYEEDDVPRTFGLVYGNAHFMDSTSSIGSDVSEPESSQAGSRAQSFSDVGDRFQHDTVTILIQRMQEGKMADDMLSELMGLRFSGGADETQVRRAVATALMKHIHALTSSGSSTAAEASKTILKKYHTLIRRAGSQQTIDEQVLFILDTQKDLAHRSEGGKILVFVVKDLYELEVLEEDAIVAWWESPKSKETEELRTVREPSKQFVEWLENAESEDEDEDDEDDDDDDDDEDEDED